MKLTQSLTFDDVLIRPAYSKILPREVDTKTKFSSDIDINIPIISAAMDTVTEAKLAISISQCGGIGVIHKNNSIDVQVSEVIKVKKYESGMVVDPVTISVDSKLYDLIELKKKFNISGFPVVDKNNRVVGIITNRDVRFSKNLQQPIKELMTRKNLITSEKGISKTKASGILRENKIEKLIIIDKHHRCIGLITVTDIEKSEKYPLATKDNIGRLRVAAAVGVGGDSLHRSERLVEAGVDALVLDTAHAHSSRVINTIKELKKVFKDSVQILAGNIATAEGASELIKYPINGLKVGIGPGSICTTRVIAGVGVPQFSAIDEVFQKSKKKNIPIIADGGIRYSGDVAKAIGAGADSVMIGSLLAGTEESPGEVFLYQGRSYKSYRGMGSLAAMETGSSDRYFQQDIEDKLKFVPEGVEGRVPYKGIAADVVFQLVGGLRAAMGYTGNKNIKQMKQKCNFIKITQAGFKESHIHDIAVTREAPNYKTER
ncbi:MAG: IMP dehydrogenase [Pelagibacterales bacterium]|nr:IMP dehydrogenase [Pelagibacterales bacterium]|tara:strand:+ start:4076 stop:5539 length:1464 start_codon:yes stop_codon:yes gene_type:complete